MRPETSSTGGKETLTYLLTYVALMVLLALTWGAAYLPLGHFHVAVALAIALAKASLVAVIFMGLRGGNRLTWIFVGAAACWLMILFGLMLSDYLSRGWSPFGAR